MTGMDQSGDCFQGQSLRKSLELWERTLPRVLSQVKFARRSEAGAAYVTCDELAHLIQYRLECMGGVPFNTLELESARGEAIRRSLVKKGLLETSEVRGVTIEGAVVLLDCQPRSRVARNRPVCPGASHVCALVWSDAYLTPVASSTRLCVRSEDMWW